MGNSCTSSSQTQNADKPEKYMAKYKRSEVAQHNTPEDCWIILDQVIYDVTDYWKVHPGGGVFVLKWAGKDATGAFREYGHSPYALAQLFSLGAEVGYVVDDPIFDPQYFQPTEIKSKVPDLEDQQLDQQGKDSMSCYQCSQASKNLGCHTVGICGKSPTIAGLQDLLIHYAKGVAHYALEDQSLWTESLLEWYLEAIFMTLTNVNFNKERHIEMLQQGYKEKMALQDKLKQKNGGNLSEKLSKSPSNFEFKDDIDFLLKESREVGILNRKKDLNPDLFGLIEMCTYGMKGCCAYFCHAEKLRQADKSIYTDEERLDVYKQIFEVMAGLTNSEPTLEYLLGLNMQVGKINLTGLTFLDKGHTTLFGRPSPAKVNRTPIEGKCILVSGHDILVLKKILELTEGKGINVYTHGELLPAHGYPKLREHKHLVGNFGGAWYDQNKDFQEFPGAILFNSNCIIQPKVQYKNRVFTSQAVGWDGITHIKDENYQPVIDCALKNIGFKKSQPQFTSQARSDEECGYGHETLAELLVPAVQGGHLKKIFVVGGCDSLEPERDFYRQIALNLPADNCVLTLGCGKFRLLEMRDKMGTISGNATTIPRVLDIGQCNDSFSAVKTALNLAAILKCGVNDLPLHLVLAWVEQKAVVILLTLLHLGIQNIIIGPQLPAFLTPNLINYLVQNFKLKTIDNNDLYRAINPRKIITPATFDFDYHGEPIQEFSKIGFPSMYKLLKRDNLVPNVFRYRLGFKNPDSVFMGVPGQHVLLRVSDAEGHYVTRPFTPVSKVGTVGHFDILIKYRDQGLISDFLKSMETNQLIEVIGGIGSVKYTNGSIQYEGLDAVDRKISIKKVNLISGGLGLVSTYQILQAIADNPNDNTQAKMLTQWNNKDQVVYGDEIKTLCGQKQNGQLEWINRISVDEGRIDANCFKNQLFESADDVAFVVCGPRGFTKMAVNILNELNWNKNLVLFY